MKLSTYLKKHGITSQAFASKLRVSISSVNKYRMEIRAPHRKRARQIEKVTNGLVTEKDWR